MFERYAVFYTPPEGELARFGAAWLGWDSARGCEAAHPELPCLDLPRITARPRPYGLHATIKAPFHLAQGTTADALDATLAALCAQSAPVTLPQLVQSQAHGFVALRPANPLAELTALETRVVQQLDPFRAPLTEDALAKRRRTRLSPRQEAYLVQWGYPYVMEEFNFHITLTGRLAAATGADVQAQVARHLTATLSEPLVIDALTLMGQDQDGRFHQIQRHTLVG